MNKVGIFYGTTSGTTEGVLDEILFYLKGNDYEVFNVADGIDRILEFKNLILISPTYGVGELQEDWENVYDDMKKIDFKGKNVAIVGLGNQFTFGESFVGAMRKIYDAVKTNGADVVGFTSTNGYSYQDTEAVIDGKFVGLVLDEANQDNKTPDRIKEWMEDIKSIFKFN